MQIYADRQALHRIPELVKDLDKTMAYLKNALSGLGCQVFSPSEGALAAWFDFGQKETIAFRADADALPIQEKTGAEYASQHPGCMHACGHDGHMAILLELARRLDKKESLPNNVLLVFQPAEETLGGAKDLCDTGIFEQYAAKAIFGLHLWPGVDAGVIASRPNELMARSCEVTADIYGRSAHIAKADQGIDALAAGTEFFSRCVAMEKSLPPEIYRLLKFGKFHSGTARNALSAHTHIEGSLRAFQDAVFESLRSGILEIGSDVEAKYGCRVQLHFSTGYRAAVPFREIPEPFMTSEDFSWYQRRLPGLFFFLGLGDTPALHSDTFDFDEKWMLKGADFFEALAEAAL